jgi:hypothetical protein
MTSLATFKEQMSLGHSETIVVHGNLIFFSIEGFLPHFLVCVS